VRLFQNGSSPPRHLEVDSGEHRAWSESIASRRSPGRPPALMRSHRSCSIKLRRELGTPPPVPQSHLVITVGRL
jgi:hypothetical protein